MKRHRLSHSSINLFDECPKKWYFKYILKMPEKPRHFFSFGKSLHSALEFMYGGDTLPAPTLKAVLAEYEDKWLSEGYKDEEDEAKYKREGRVILEEYYEKHSSGFKLPYFVEYQFNLMIDPKTHELSAFDAAKRDAGFVSLLGYVDRIDRIGDDKLVIVDYKTGKPLTRERVKGDPQLTLYQMACEELLGLKVDSVRFYHLNSQTEHASDRRGAELVEALKDRIVKVSDRIEKAISEGADGEGFEPKINRFCDWCDFKRHCPVFKHQYARAEAPVEAKVLKSDEKIARLVDRYGAMKEDLREREAKAEAVKAAIVEALREKGYVRAFGGRYEATAHADEVWEFSADNKAKVLDAIKSAGFWDRIVGPMAPRVQKLLKDPNLPLDVRDRIQRLGKKTVHTTVRVKKVEEVE